MVATNLVKATGCAIPMKRFVIRPYMLEPSEMQRLRLLLCQTHHKLPVLSMMHLSKTMRLCKLPGCNLWGEFTNPASQNDKC
jgi:hypothetical protein